MINDISVIVALLLLGGFIKLCQEEVKPFSNIESKWQVIITAFLFLVLLAAGAHNALSSDLPKQTQNVLLFMIFGSIVSGAIAVILGLLVKKIKRSSHETDHKYSSATGKTESHLRKHG